jgi:dihydroneopterin aldolase/2-amino-4-hydroxy-6-hydroxymethyldihydropteridine diphosphokinase
MKDRITLTGLTARGRHGVMPEERRNGQDFVVDVALHVDVATAAATDDIADTVHYGLLARAVLDVVEGEPCDLIETLAERIAEVCLAPPLVQAADVTVHKPQAPVGVPFTDVSVRVSRSARRSRQAVLALGANLGDRAATLQGAVRALAAQPQLRVVDVSAVYESDPVGGPEQPPYLNAVVLAETTLAPEALLAAAHRVEAAYGRVRDVRWGARTLDVDLISLGDVTRSTPRLQLPHPRAQDRAFVLVPWLDVDPDASLAGHGRVGELLRGADVAGVRRADQISLEVP